MTFEGSEIIYSRLSSSSLLEKLNETLSGHRNGDLLTFLFIALVVLVLFFAFPPSRHCCVLILCPTHAFFC